MATLVLQTVGSAVAGPVGALVGATLGYQLDQQLIGKSRRHGPRLGDLAVQGSHYGAPIPKIYGTMRVAGSVVWATDLIESEAVTGAKGQPETVSYSYSVSFAVLLSARKATGIGRVWADGKLLRGAAGDLKVGGEMRFHAGGEDQAIDPLIASLEADAPAYRGRAMVVFENLELAEYANRIPMLTFEIFADGGSTTIGALLSDASDNAISSGNPEPVDGYAVHGRTLRDAIDPLVRLHSLDFTQCGSKVIEGYGSVETRSVDPSGIGVVDNIEAVERHRLPIESLPRQLTIDHHDPARDYQAGRVIAEGDPTAREAVRIDAPLVMTGDRARALGEAALLDHYLRRERMTMRLSPAYSDLRPGDAIAHQGQAWQITQLSLEQGEVVIEARLSGHVNSISTIAADSGKPSPARDEVTSPSKLAIFDLPDLGKGASVNMALAAASSSSGWKAVALAVEAGGQLTGATTSGRETVLGFAEYALAEGSTVLIDRTNQVVVELVDADHWLEPTDEVGLAAGMNLAVLGDELIQFSEATPLGGGRFRLSGLLRGRRGSEWAMAGHEAGEPFAMIDGSRLAKLSVARELVGGELSVTPFGLADQAAQPVMRTISGEALRPPSPVHISSHFASDGSLTITWIARSRLAWGWVDGPEPGAGETSTRYVVKLTAAGFTLRREVEVTNATFSSVELAALDGQAVTVSVEAIGDLAASHPATTQIQF